MQFLGVLLSGTAIQVSVFRVARLPLPSSPVCFFSLFHSSLALLPTLVSFIAIAPSELCCYSMFCAIGINKYSLSAFLCVVFKYEFVFFIAVSVAFCAVPMLCVVLLVLCYK